MRIVTLLVASNFVYHIPLGLTLFTFIALLALLTTITWVYLLEKKCLQVSHARSEMFASNIDFLKYFKRSILIDV